MTFSEVFILKKIGETENYLKEVKDLFKLTDNTIIKSSGNLHIAERLLQLIVDTALDINQHLIKELKLKATDDFQSTFYVLADNKVLSNHFARKIASVVGLRNRIVHRYDTLDYILFIKTFRTNVNDFNEYLKLIKKYLKK